MIKYIAFLRAINVGGHTVKMDRLRDLFAALGFSNVETFIASGNVIFEANDEGAQALEKKIEAHLRKSLGYEVATFLRSALELAAVARYQPFPAAELEAEGNTLYIGFLPAPPDHEARQRLLALRTEIDEFHVHEREIYWLCRKKFSESKVSGATLEKRAGMPATLRNSTTVRKIAAKYSS
ncbi:MAG TPA: DUF1697 domain-containing protein [Thermoanaerobaculia bacterium]|nr:DUF1697 domain-containing protein [Thermoanaerobaculia bacterium]